MQPKLHDKPQNRITYTTDYQQITHSLNNTESRFSVIPACSQENVTGSSVEMRASERHRRAPGFGKSTRFSDAR